MKCCVGLRDLAILCLDEVLSSKYVWSARETKLPVETGLPGARVKESWFSVAAISSIKSKIWFFLLGLFFPLSFLTLSPLKWEFLFWGSIFKSTKQKVDISQSQLGYIKCFAVFWGLIRDSLSHCNSLNVACYLVLNPPWTKSHASCMINNGFVSWCGRSLI